MVPVADNRLAQKSKLGKQTKNQNYHDQLQHFTLKQSMQATSRSADRAASGRAVLTVLMVHV